MDALQNLNMKPFLNLPVRSLHKEKALPVQRAFLLLSTGFDEVNAPFVVGSRIYALRYRALWFWLCIIGSIVAGCVETRLGIR